MPTPDDPDEPLADAAQRGDRAAFHQLVDRYALRLVRLLHLTHRLPLDRAEDVAQETWLRAWRKLPAKEPGPFRGWLFTIARRLASDNRGLAAHRLTSHDPDGDIIPLVTAADPGPERQAAGRDTARKLADCLGKLDERSRAAVVGFAAGESYAELCARLDFEPNTLKSRLSRSRDALRTCLGEDAA